MMIKDGLKFSTVELLLLSLLKDEDKYGYQLTQEIASKSGNIFHLKEGSMYPVLYKLIDKGLISDRAEKVGVRRTRIYYHLEPAGEAYFENLKSDYAKITKAVINVVNNLETNIMDEEEENIENTIEENEV
ncbi:MAG: PadR family transcriptional regulator [Acutalibacteraceae bacterium]